MEYLNWLQQCNNCKAGALLGSVLGCVLYALLKGGLLKTELITVAALSVVIGMFVPTMVQFIFRQIKPQPGRKRHPTEASIETPALTTSAITTQFTILEMERNRLVPIAAREHWVALMFAIIAGSIFFTSINLVIFSSLTKAIVTFVASLVPGFLSKIFFAREATVEKRLKEISSDLREAEKTKERFEILQRVLLVTPPEHQARLLEDFTKKPLNLLPKP